MLVDGSGVAILFIQAVTGGEPHKATRILQNRINRSMRKTFVHRDALELEVPGLGMCGSRNSESEDKVYEILKRHDYFTTILPFPCLVILPTNAESLTPFS